MIDFVIGAVLGGAAGITAMCFCAASAKADREIDRCMRDDDVGKEKKEDNS